MKALSIYSPYASAIANGIKIIELRSWRTSYTGKLLICSTKENSKCKDMKDDFIFGKALAVVDLIGCEPVQEQFLDFALVDTDDPEYDLNDYKDLYAWGLDNIKPIKPFDVKGKLRLFDVDESQIEYLDIDLEKNPSALQEYWLENGYIKKPVWEF